METEDIVIIHPGEVLAEEFLGPLGITPYRLAKDLGVDPPRIYALLDGRRAITADTALRLARYFDTTAEFWMNLQAHHDLRVARAELGGTLEAIRRAAG